MLKIKLYGKYHKDGLNRVFRTSKMLECYVQRKII